ncbi:hypothetical protein AUEXF2481DRAFT_337220 [Aureobasidium subglaciale EXF-2481]|uniref:Uncharacterized protein n=1 Tax=Aureobasidium subglaciale (strain EXF-2481) TaxID=1043005 RepID=A0A074YBC4_AURSE|nr:uncharacterized protein AUEXF2481DRAFT_337220 [Aureobasidium subglaciale EXF-2481]KEQ93309.1 hypothetical protein AUEXF2481DRAFT_337220 [Aureobasidium subglaciale EXF-2481]
MQEQRTTESSITCGDFGTEASLHLGSPRPVALSFTVRANPILLSLTIPTLILKDHIKGTDMEIEQCQRLCFKASDLLNLETLVDIRVSASQSLCIVPASGLGDMRVSASRRRRTQDERTKRALLPNEKGIAQRVQPNLDIKDAKPPNAFDMPSDLTLRAAVCFWDLSIKLIGESSSLAMM